MAKEMGCMPLRDKHLKHYIINVLCKYEIKEIFYEKELFYEYYQI